jgi:hypothetical protein
LDRLHQLLNMTDYNKLTVANLKGLLKERGIPQTGLTRKAQIIEALEARDNEGESAAAEAEAGGDAPEPQQEERATEAQDEAAVTEGALLQSPMLTHCC